MVNKLKKFPIVLLLSVAMGFTRLPSPAQRINSLYANERRGKKAPFRIVVLGDLHLQDDMTQFNEAREDIIGAVELLERREQEQSAGGAQAEVRRQKVGACAPTKSQGQRR